MSSRSWTEEGYGMKLFDGDNSEAIKKFICDNTRADHPNEWLRITDEQKAQIMRWDDSDAVYAVLDNCPSGIIAEIINTMEGTSIFRGYAPDCDTDQEEMIGAEPVYPWYMNEKDKTLTEEQVKEILVKYAAMFGNHLEPEHFDAEYYG